MRKLERLRISAKYSEARPVMPKEKEAAVLVDWAKLGWPHSVDPVSVVVRRWPAEAESKVA